MSALTIALAEPPFPSSVKSSANAKGLKPAPKLESVIDHSLFAISVIPEYFYLTTRNRYRLPHNLLCETKCGCVLLYFLLPHTQLVLLLVFGIHLQAKKDESLIHSLRSNPAHILSQYTLRRHQERLSHPPPPQVP